MIGVSGAFVSTGTVGGAEYMLYNLVRGMALVSPAGHPTLFVRRGSALDPAFRRAVDELSSASRLAVAPVSGRNRFVAEHVGVSREARRLRLQSVLFANYFTPPRRQPFRVATVIHDLQSVHLPQNFSRRKRLWLAFAHRLTLRYADDVVVISEAVRRDVLQRYGRPSSARLHVIPNPVCWERFDARIDEGAAPVAGPARPYILSVASQYPHKNLDTLVRAFARASRTLPDHALVLAGQLGHRLRGVPSRTAIDLGPLIESLGLAGRVHVTGHVSDAALGRLYRNADVFVLPSLFEGFGMPAVEALGMGLPTLTTRCASLPEVTLGKAVYLQDPTDVDECARWLAELVRHPGRYRPSRETAASVRAHYAPRRIAQEYLRVLLQ